HILRGGTPRNRPALKAIMQRTSLAATRLGIGLYLLGVFFFALNDALGKWLVADYGVGQLLFLRSVGALIVLAPFAWRVRKDLFVKDRWGLQLLRVIGMTADSWCFYAATRTMPLADVMTFYMAAPLIITALSAPLLGERVGAVRWGAVLVGFVGVLVALQPSSAAFSPDALIALFGATMFGLSITITRQLRQTHWLPLVTVQFAFTGLFGAGMSAIHWVQPGLVDLSLMFLLGIVAMGCFVAIAKALSIAPASVLAPFQYSSIVWATILGVMIWNDIPTVPILIGNAIIIASGLFVFYNETRVRAEQEPQSV
ncbi:MAG: DMT family transporter, partial [Alphaproteobacteria bacterium]